MIVITIRTAYSKSTDLFYFYITIENHLGPFYFTKPPVLNVRMRRKNNKQKTNDR